MTHWLNVRGCSAGRDSLDLANADANLDLSRCWGVCLNGATSASGSGFPVSEHADSPAVGPVAAGSTDPGASFLDSRDGFAGQVGCGRAWIRFQAVMIALAQGQVAASLRVLRLPPRTGRGAVLKTQWRSVFG